MTTKKRNYVIIEEDLFEFLEKKFGIMRDVFLYAEYHPDMEDKTYVITRNGKQYSAQYTYDLVLQIEKEESRVPEIKTGSYDEVE